jgi:hypothetical protein
MDQKAQATSEPAPQGTKSAEAAPSTTPVDVEKLTETSAKTATEPTVAKVEAVKESSEQAAPYTTAKSSAAVVSAETKATEEVAASVPSVQAPETITLDASYGKITFPHAMHAKSFECTLCHTGTPGPFDLTKEVAHPLCKGCHKEQGAGPTGCKGCHQKG